MVFIHEASAHSIVHKLDPRLRLLVALIFSCVVVGCVNLKVLLIALFCSLSAVIASRLSAQMVFKRLLKLNIFMFLLVVFAGKDGRLAMVVIVLKSNALILWLSAFLSTIDATSLGHALNHLKVSDKMTHLFLTTVRYIDVLFIEYQRLVQAMKVRGFQPHMNGHTYRVYAYLVGMLLV